MAVGQVYLPIGSNPRGATDKKTPADRRKAKCKAGWQMKARRFKVYVVWNVSLIWGGVCGSGLWEGL